MSLWIIIVNTEQISHIALVFPLLTLNKWIPAGKIFQALQNIIKKIEWDLGFPI